MYKMPSEVPEIFAALLLAEMTGPMRPIGTLKSHEGLPFINDLSTRWHTSAGLVRQLPRLCLAPQVIITAKGGSDAEEKADFLLMKECPRHRGWSNHRTVVNNMSMELRTFLDFMPSSGGHALGMYLINCVGLRYGENGLLRQYNISGASSGTDEYHAYGRFKETFADGQFFAEPYWVGGTARILKIPEKRLLHWKEEWVPLHRLHQWAPEAQTLAH